MPTTFRFSWLLSLVFSLLFLSSSSGAATLSDVDQANSLLKRAETNLRLVDSSIGHLTSPPKGSAAKLASMRLAQCVGDLQAAGKLAASLSGPGAAEAVHRYTTDKKLYDKLAGILTGSKPKPKPKPEPGPEPSPQPKPGSEPNTPPTVKLGYPHADNFKNALFGLRRVEGESAGLTQLHAELLPLKDQLTIDHRKTAGALESLKETRRQAGFVATGLAKIPSNGEGVAEAKQRLASVINTLNGTEKYLVPLNTRLLDLVNPANYPEFDKDVKRLEELSMAYNNLPTLFREQRPNAAEAFLQRDVAKAECMRIAKAYARLMQQQTAQGKRIESVGNGFLNKQAAFIAAAEEQRASLPADIRGDLAEANKFAEQAVQDQKPLWFTGGIPQRMGWAADKLALYAALHPTGAPALQKEFDSTQASLRKRADSLKELIIRENPLPNDKYAGADREAVIAIAIDAWQAQEEDFELLAIRIPSEAWLRETKWSYSNGTWYFIDKSKLQIRLIVADKNNPEQAIDRPINVKKDHQQGDAMIGMPMRSFGEDLQPDEYLLRSRLK